MNDTNNKLKPLQEETFGPEGLTRKEIEEGVADDFYASEDPSAAGWVTPGRTFNPDEAVSYNTVIQLMAIGAIFAASKGRVTPASMPLLRTQATSRFLGSAATPGPWQSATSALAPGVLGSGRAQGAFKAGASILSGGMLVALANRWFGDKETIPIGEVAQKAGENGAEVSGNPLKDADIASDEAVTRSIDAVMSPEEIEAGMTAAEKVASQLGNLEFDSDPTNFDPANQGISNLISDAEFLNVVNIETPTGTFSTPWSAIAKGGSPLISGLPMPGTIGYEDVSYYDIYDTLLPAGRLQDRAWEIDEERVADGQMFFRRVQEDVPFTVQDAIAIYDAQDPSTQRLIAESLAIGTGTESFMAEILGNQMFTTPSMIYDRESVMFALMKLGEVAGARAGLLGGGVEAYELLDMIPDLRKADFEMAEAPEESLTSSGMVSKQELTIGQLTDELFDLATNLGVVKTISQTHSRALASQVYRALIGRNPDEFALELFDEWTLEKQKETMGASNPTESQFKTHYASKIEEEPEFEADRDLFATENLLDSFLKVLGS